MPIQHNYLDQLKDTDAFIVRVADKGAMVESDVEQRKGNWKIRDAKKAFEVEQKTCLIIGLGTIGKIIAHLCIGLDMKVIGYDTFLTAEQMHELGVEKVDDKFEALKAADVVIVQMPLIEGVTTNTIAKAELDAMKPTAIFYVARKVVAPAFGQYMMTMMDTPCSLRTLLFHRISLS